MGKCVAKAVPAVCVPVKRVQGVLGHVASGSSVHLGRLVLFFNARYAAYFAFKGNSSVTRLKLERARAWTPRPEKRDLLALGHTLSECTCAVCDLLIGHLERAGVRKLEGVAACARHQFQAHPLQPARPIHQLHPDWLQLLSLAPQQPGSPCGVKRQLLSWSVERFEVE